MLEFIKTIPFTYAALFPVINPLGSAVIFLSMTVAANDAEHRRLARHVAFNTFILLVVVLLTGSWILRFFGISLAMVQIGGGLVLAYIGWGILNKPISAGSENFSPGDKAIDGMAFFPLTMPITAGPGSIAVTLTIGAHEMSQSFTTGLLGEVGVVIGILLSALTVFLCYRYAARITNKLGQQGTQVILRLAAFINLCIGLEIIWHGIQSLIW